MVNFYHEINYIYKLVFIKNIVKLKINCFNLFNIALKAK